MVFCIAVLSQSEIDGRNLGEDSSREELPQFEEAAEHLDDDDLLNTSLVKVSDLEGSVVPGVPLGEIISRAVLTTYVDNISML